MLGRCRPTPVVVLAVEPCHRNGPLARRAAPSPLALAERAVALGRVPRQARRPASPVSRRQGPVLTGPASRFAPFATGPHQTPSAGCDDAPEDGPATRRRKGYQREPRLELAHPATAPDG